MKHDCLPVHPLQPTRAIKSIKEILIQIDKRNAPSRVALCSCVSFSHDTYLPYGHVMAASEMRGIDRFALGSSPYGPDAPRTYGPFVPHNLISAQDSPVPLPKFQMAPMSSGSKKGTQIYFPFHSKVPVSESPPGSPAGSLWREISAYRAILGLS
jgi:hypothetical protein